MRRPCVLTCAWSPMQCPVLSHRWFSPQQRIGISRSRAPCIPVVNPLSGHGKLEKVRQRQRRRLRGLACLAEGLQRSANLQAFTEWLIDSGSQGVNGDTQKVEIYNYGENGRGLQATTVLHQYCSLSPVAVADWLTSMPTLYVSNSAYAESQNDVVSNCTKRRAKLAFRSPVCSSSSLTLPSLFTLLYRTSRTGTSSSPCHWIWCWRTNLTRRSSTLNWETTWTSSRPWL